MRRTSRRRARSRSVAARAARVPDRNPLRSGTPAAADVVPGAGRDAACLAVRAPPAGAPPSRPVADAPLPLGAEFARAGGLLTAGLGTEGDLTAGPVTRGVRTVGVRTVGVETDGVCAEGTVTCGVRTAGVETDGACTGGTVT